jgi:hypothetical protein
VIRVAKGISYTSVMEGNNGWHCSAAGVAAGAAGAIRAATICAIERKCSGGIYCRRLNAVNESDGEFGGAFGGAFEGETPVIYPKILWNL